jgi:hypothetical protein
MNATLPKVGQLVKVYGLQCRIFKVRPAGTIDVLSLDGTHAYRVSGLGFVKAPSGSIAVTDLSPTERVY